MVNGLHLYSAFLVIEDHTTGLIYSIHTLTTGSFFYLNTNLSISIIHSQSYTNGTTIRGNVGFSVLRKDTSTCSPAEPGIEPPTFRLGDDSLNH